MIFSDGYYRYLWLENAYWMGQHDCDTCFDELIGEAGLFKIMQSQEYVWLCSGCQQRLQSISVN